MGSAPPPFMEVRFEEESGRGAAAPVFDGGEAAC